MSNPLRSMKYLPWRSLFQISALTICVAFVLDMLLIRGLENTVMRRSLEILFAPPLGEFMVIALSMGIGALAVYLMDRFYKEIAITNAVLWSLVLSLMVTLLVKSWLPLPTLLVHITQSSLLGIILGVFLGGWSHWRRY
jgi:hypothetical protein